MKPVQNKLRLGVNIDHVATIRNARGGIHPDPVRAALMAADAGADGITAHLREDRRHISDDDIARLRSNVALPLNLEMAATEEMLAIALRHLPNAACLVPERRQELTTEGGLNIHKKKKFLHDFVQALKAADIRVSLFIDPSSKQIEAAAEIGADIVELHTGRYCEAALNGDKKEEAKELKRLVEGAAFGAELNLEVHAGHGLDFATVKPVAAIPELVELNIGHFLIGEAIFTGIEAAVTDMRKIMNEVRLGAQAEQTS
ncbi:MAG: pyridoxine 5'-phosphate synthase [Rhizobiales bacterium]|nr:pyridoxine 5'-phosphate synthase [Hyphomicrobiales bacterium]